MSIASQTHAGARGAIGRCRGCGNILPLRWPAESETAQDWVCVACGERYQGILIQNLPREYARNVRPATAAVAESVSLADMQLESFLNPACANAGHPEPITIAFPDRSGIVCDLENSFSRDLDSQISRPENLILPAQTSPFSANVQDRQEKPYDTDWMRKAFEQVNEATDNVSQQFAALKDGGRGDLAILHTIVQNQLWQILEDKDAFACLGIQPHVGDYPSRHALQVSMLAISMGLTMGWDAETLADLGMGCLIHDAGMVCLDESQYGRKGIISAHDLGEIAKHTVIGLEAFDHRTGEISHRALFVAYQMHERCNGTGYPRACTIDQIHPLSRVAAIADVFVALVSPRPYRPGLVPYHAIKKIMQDTERGLFDKAIRQKAVASTPPRDQR